MSTPICWWPHHFNRWWNRGFEHHPANNFPIWGCFRIVYQFAQNLFIINKVGSDLGSRLFENPKLLIGYPHFDLLRGFLSLGGDLGIRTEGSSSLESYQDYSYGKPNSFNWAEDLPSSTLSWSPYRCTEYASSKSLNGWGNPSITQERI